MLDKARLAICSLAAAGGTGVAALMGGWDSLLEVLITLMILDYAGGVLHAIVTKSLDSKIGSKGIAKKIGYLIAVIVACLVDRTLGMPAPLARTAIILFLIANESLSILEHMGQLGVPIPKWLLDRLHKLQVDQEAIDPLAGQGPGVR